MILSRLALKNWRNFRSVDVPLGVRVFIVGPNASGKSNLLDALRFLRDIAKDGGGLQQAIGIPGASGRGGFSKIRCLAARTDPDVEIDISLADGPSERTLWRYAIGIRQEVRGYRLPYLTFERVWQGERLILDRPDNEDKKDKLRLTETHLQQISKNADFRTLARFLESLQYLHVIPQLVRDPHAFLGQGMPHDPFGGSLLERVARTTERTRKARLKKIEDALRIAVPQLRNLVQVKDPVTGMPHLEATYEHWRAKGARQREDQFSDGTLRLVGLLWSLLDGEAPLLLEEPELSLNSAIVQVLPSLIARLQRPKRRQVLLSTHSGDLLMDKGIGGNEIVMLRPSAEGTIVKLASSVEDVRVLLEHGATPADAVLPHMAPRDIVQLTLFEA